MQIRAMGYDDLDAVMAIEEEAFTSPWIPEGFVGELIGPVSHCIVAEDDLGCLLGFAVYRVIIDEAHLLNIAIKVADRGSGLGREILDHILEHCRNLGAEYLFLEVRPSNLAARRLYGRAGFYTLGVRRQYYTDNQEDALILKLDL
jgi:[ribosomal protein S18]-alanine N-acetyltransferase